MVALILTLLLATFVAAAPGKLGVVVARFKEPLDPWAPHSNLTTIYAKGNVPQENDTIQHSSFRSYVPLPNIGREGHTHLFHIATNYDTLDDVMIFTQADPFDLLAPAATTPDQMIEMALQVPADDVTPFNPTLFHDVADWTKIDWNSSKQALWITESQKKTLALAPYTPGQFWTRVVGSRHPPAIRAMHGGTFSVRRETIQRLPKVVYQKALDEFEKANSSNPEIGFFMERMWAPMFSDKYRLGAVDNP
ncbi:hypothetical protein GCG54_00013041 [Colletotrichum gloeosporioides]|uniref:Uncharacterized protein n=1 Tax=Colletotrichum gloeosporioides TaxID=474922 RepID=A0A8H4CR72_COLGL|nr:uncharacterized protein GCG54_00013041 [Colletotrichum gloeosporioides]KAF3808402.1 hypothetical protein GCG54_00013041 [Colletotrichum gloeosporioides]